MEHYDWNEGWLFTPRFDPALVRPECGLELEPVRIPHTVRVLPYNYCNEILNQFSLVSDAVAFSLISVLDRQSQIGRCSYALILFFLIIKQSH